MGNVIGFVSAIILILLLLVLLIANISDEAQTAELDLHGVDVANADITRIDTEYCFQRTGESITDHTIRLPWGSCVEIFFH